MESTELSGHLRTDVDSAIARAKKKWDPVASHVDNEAAYLDRFVLAAEVLILRQELADTQDAQKEAEQEVNDLLDRIHSIKYTDL